MIRATCSMRKAFVCNLAHCFRAFPDWSLRKFRKPPFAAAPRESSTSCSRMQLMRWGTARLNSLDHLGLMWWQREIPGVFCKCNLHWRDGDRRPPWCTRFKFSTLRFAASRANLSDVDQPCQFLLEGDAGFLGDIAQLLDDRQNQRDAICAALVFCFAFRVAGQEGPVGAGSGFGGAKDADVVVNLALERIAVDEAVDLHSTKEMADAIADAALGNFLTKSKGRSERPPIRAAENAAEDVHHNGETVALVPAAVAIGTQRQKRAAVDHIIRIACSPALAVDGPALGNALAAPP